jgi:hypothetical protein
MTVNIYPRPPGLLGEIADYIHGQAPYPIIEVALGAGAALMAGVCGAAFQTPAPMAGLNLYVMVVAPTGEGKEAGHDGIDALIKAVIDGCSDTQLPDMPSAQDFIGPSHFASETALVRHLAGRSRCFVSIIGEAGKWLQRVSNPRGSQHDKDVGAALLKLYGKSRHHSVYRGSVFADTTKNIPNVSGPAVTIYAEGTPETVFANMTDDLVTDGLFPRFLVLESFGRWPDLNRNAMCSPPAELTAKLSALCLRALQLMQQDATIQVRIAPDADALLEDFRVAIRTTLKDARDEVSRHLWSRSHLRAVKLASLAAVGVDMEVPTITRDIALWAIQVEKMATNGVSARFDRGDAGGSENNEAKQERELKSAIKRYLTTEYDALKNTARTTRAMHADHIIPDAYLQQSVANNSAFTKDRLGKTAALKRAIGNMLTADYLIQLDPGTAVNKYKKSTRFKAYGIGNAPYFTDQPEAEETQTTNRQFFNE